MSKKVIAIIFGGRSSEHEISCVSAGGVLEALDKSRYEAVLIGITRDGRWVHVSNDFPLQIRGGVLPEVPLDAPSVVADIHGLSVNNKALKVDVIFPLLHGPFGEDGTIQGFCEMANIAYVGSGVLASAVAMDKSFAKPIFASQEMAVVPGFVVKKSEWSSKRADYEKRAAELQFPIFVKPARGGSSRGTTKVKSANDFAAAIEEAHLFDTKALVEKAIHGLEVECAVLEINGIPEASIVGSISIDPKFEFYDFQAKYLDGATKIELPALIPSDVAEEIRKQAINAFKALGCSGLARVDFFYSTSGEIFINELNTMPGFTATSVFPKMWAATGKNYESVIEELIKTALLRTNGVLEN
ncbi:MAG: D-alanine--D-alanine ligase family protein [Candidatus Planktophila sp.]